MSRTHFRSFLDTTYLGQWDLTDAKTGKTFEPTVEIASVTPYRAPRPRRKKMPDGSYKEVVERKIEIAFKAKKKHWLANAVCRETIAAMYGNYIEDWIGKRITLYVDASVKMGKRTVGGIRVRPMVPGSNVATTLEPLDEPVDEEQATAIADAWDEVNSDAPSSLHSSPPSTRAT